MIELEHSPLGGSAAHRFMACAGSFFLHKEQLEDGTFENVESGFAQLGTAAHEVAAQALSTDTEPFEFLGEEFGGYLVGWPGGISLDAIEVYFNECQGIRDRYQRKGWTIIEKSYHLPTICPLLKGTVDFGFITDGVIFLRDYKNGEGIGVAAAGNQQLLYYAFLMAVGDAECAQMPMETIANLGIVQPNYYGVFEEADTWITTLGAVLTWGRDVLLPRMRALMLPQDISLDDFVTGPHCQFCPVLLDCPKMQAAFEEYARADEEFIAMLTDQELDNYYAMREQARRFMNALETTVHARLVGGSKNIKHAKLVEKKTARVWRPGAEAALQAALGKNAIEPGKIKSPAQVEKLSSMGKALAREWGYKPKSAGLSVAPLSDPRPEAARNGNASVFEAHAQSPEQQGF